VSDHAPARGHDSAQGGQNLGGDFFTILQRRVLQSAEQDALFRLMLQDEFAHLSMV